MHDDRLAGQVGALGVEVLELQDARPRHVLVGVVHHRRALEVVDVLDLGLEVDGAPRQPALAVAEVLVDRAGVDDRDRAAVLVGDVEEVGVQPDLDVRVVGHPGQPGGVAVDRQALVGVVEPAVGEVVADRQPADDVRAQLLGVGLPLLGGVALDERLVERAADQRDRLLLQVRGRRGVDLAGLLGHQGPRLVGGVRAAEELVDQAEVHREGVDLPPVVGEHPVLVAGEGGEPVDVLPHPLVGGVEQVGAVHVHLDAGLGLGLAVGVAAEVVAAARAPAPCRPSSLAQRSAIVSPKKPDPTMTRSGFNAHLLVWAATRESIGRPAAEPPRRAPRLAIRAPVGDRAQPLRHETVPPAHDARCGRTARGW